jgi:hypothetical protein
VARPARLAFNQILFSIMGRTRSLQRLGSLLRRAGAFGDASQEAAKQAIFDGTSVSSRRFLHTPSLRSTFLAGQWVE